MSGSDRRGALRRLLAGALVAIGVLSNLASNFVAAEECNGGYVVRAEGDAQAGAATAPLGKPLVLRVQCLGSSSGRLIDAWDVPVIWRVVSGGGQVDGREVTVTQVGSFFDPTPAAPPAPFSVAGASVNWQLGATLGEQTVQAEVGGTVTTFRATATPPTSGGTCAGGAGTDFASLRTIAGNERWVAAGRPYRGQRVHVASGATLTLDAGVSTCLEELFVSPGGALVVAGGASEPVLMAARAGNTFGWRLAVGFGAAAGDPRSEARHLRTLNLTHLFAQGAFTLEDAVLEVDSTIDRQMTCPQVEWSIMPQGEATMRRVVIDGYGGAAPTGCPALRLFAGTTPPAGPRPVQVRVLRAAGDAVVVRGTARNALALSACEVSGAGRHGVVVAADARPDIVALAGCNLVGNAGQAVLNEVVALGSVRARGNWWGAPGGPPASGANAVSAGVDAADALAAAVTLGY